jgi:hypothetical protein
MQPNTQEPTHTCNQATFLNYLEMTAIVFIVIAFILCGLSFIAKVENIKWLNLLHF